MEHDKVKSIGECIHVQQEEEHCKVKLNIANAKCIQMTKSLQVESLLNNNTTKRY